MSAKWTSINLPDLPLGPGKFLPETMLLMTDGSVLVHNGGGNVWLRYFPSTDPASAYTSGYWSASALTMINSRQYFASGVLADGRVFVIGGEYSDAGINTPLSEIFDPTTNTWTPLNKPAQFDFINGDVASCILANGQVLLGGPDGSDQASAVAVWDPNPANETWRAAGTNFGTTGDTSDEFTPAEETWTLLADGSVLTVETLPATNGPNAAQRYLPDTDQWVKAGNTPQSLVSIGPEIGPAFLLPDGRVFAVGATGYTALYDPGTGEWVNGPSFPLGPPVSTGIQNYPLLTACDAPGVLQPSGKVICVAGAYQDNNGTSVPTTFFEFDPKTFDPTSPGTLPQLAVQPPTGSNSKATNSARFLLLPSGEILFSAEESALYLYTPDPADQPDPSWKPQITNAPGAVKPNHTYLLEGRQFNGLSQAVSYGDDAQMATNYPIVRIQNVISSHVFYCRTHNHSTMGVATGTTIVSTQFTVPGDIEAGDSLLFVIANGIPSDPVSLGVIEIKGRFKEHKELETAGGKIVNLEHKQIDESSYHDGPGRDDPFSGPRGDQELVRVIRQLAAHNDLVNDPLVQRTFIREDERPDVGLKVPRQSDR